MGGRLDKAARTSLACLQVCVLLISPGTGRAQGVAEDCTDLSEVLVRGGHYYTRTDDVFTWVDAADLAQRIGGYLVVPDTSWENAWVVQQGWGDSWIGIYDPSESTAWCSGSESLCPTNPGRFRTSRGAIPRYANWETGQPDNRVFAEDTEFGRSRVDPLGEHWAVIGRNGRWGDMGNHNVMYQNPVLYRAVIEFDSAQLNGSLGFGSSDFSGQNVTFSGSLIPFVLTSEAFAFSFANPSGTPSNFTVTSSFTSSAIPEPASLLAFGLATPILMIGRRRR